MCARSGEKTALAQTSPLYRSQGHVSRRGAQARIAWRNALPGNAVDVIWKRNGGEHAWSPLRIRRVFETSSTKRCHPVCIGCQQTAGKVNERPKNASTDQGLSDVDVSHDQSSRWQKFAAVPEEIFESKVQGKTHSCRRRVNSDQSEQLPKADIGSAGGHIGFGPRAGLARLLSRQICSARLTPTQATNRHSGRVRLPRYLRRARYEPLLWHVPVARPRHFRGAQATGQPA